VLVNAIISIKEIVLIIGFCILLRVILTVNIVAKQKVLLVTVKEIVVSTLSDEYPRVTRV
jgi:hypothetical protein